MTLVSVVIPTCNRASLVGDAIESVLSVQRHGFELEVIVVDDGSTDGTRAIVAQYPVVYMQSHGMGAAAARNAGIKIARGDFIAFLDDDDVWLPTNVAPQLKMFAANPSFGAVLAQVLCTEPDRTGFGTLFPVGPLSSGWIFNDLLSYWPQVAALLVRRSVLEEVGLFDASLCSEEEWDLILRIARRYPIGRVEEPVALFRQHDGGEIQRYHRMHDMFKVFHRHTHAEPRLRRVALQRQLWRHRGWFASQFMSTAQVYAHYGEVRRTLRSLRYALVASPPHMLLKSAQIWQTLVAIISVLSIHNGKIG